jgi:hypothetical protein
MESFRNLTQEQIDNLFEFCEFQNVRFYDVQVELVDHMASAIEEIWKTNPDLQFEEAVIIVGEQFGVNPFFHADYQSLLPPLYGKQIKENSGFDAIVEAREKELRRKYEHLQWKYIREFFRLPKIILTIIVTLAVFLILRISENDLKTSLIILFIYLIAITIFLTVFFPKKFKLTLIPGKSFLLYEHFKSIRKSIISVGFFPLPIFNVLLNGSNIFNKNLAFTNTILGELLSAFLITVFGITMIVMTIYMPKRIKADFIREFPQFVKA